MEPLLDRTAHGLIRKPLEIHSASPIHLQLSTAQVPLRCWDVYLNLNTRAAAILLAASDMHNRGFVEYLERGSKVVLRHSVRRPPGGRGYYGGSRSVNMFYQFPEPHAGKWCGIVTVYLVEGGVVTAQ